MAESLIVLGAIALTGLVVYSVRRRRAQRPSSSAEPAMDDLRAQAGRLRAIVETAVDGIITIDERGCIETVNPATERLFGYSAEAMIGRNVSMLMPEPYHSEHDAYLQRYRTTGTRKIIGIGREVRGRRKDGTEFPLDLAVSETQLPGGRRFFTGIIRDVTERNTAEEALRRSEDRLAGIVGSAMDAIITVDENQRIVLFNAAAEAIFRYPASEAIGQPVDRFVPQRFRRAHGEHIRDFGRTGVTSRSMWRPGTLLALRPDGEEFPIEATISQIESAGQKFYTVILRDITERVRAEERLREALDTERLLRADAESANRAKDQFLAVVSHELRTPLNAIIGYADLMSAGVSGPITQQQQVHLNRIAASSQHLLNLIDQVLTFARNQAITVDPRVERVNLAAVLTDAATLVEPTAGAKGLEYRIDVAAADVAADTDPAMLRQIVLNLLSNAVKFTERGCVKLVGRVVDSQLELNVIDTGVGVPSADQPRLFEPFWQADSTLTRRVGGTGLGLSVVQRLVHGLGGTIAVTSEVGDGSTFTVRLPLHAGVTDTAHVS